jgi:hypothetical protein
MTPRGWCGLVLALAGGTAVILVAAAAEPAPLRLGLQAAGLWLAVGGAWFLAPRLGRASADARSERTLAALAADRRMPGLDRHSGLFAEWYFLLRAGDELERARRFEEALALVSVAGAPDVLEQARNVVGHGLRHIDIAGDLGDSLAVLLPHTDRAGATMYANRLREELARAEVSVLAYPDDGQALVRALRADELHFRPPQDVTPGDAA